MAKTITFENEFDDITFKNDYKTITFKNVFEVIIFDVIQEFKQLTGIGFMKIGSTNIVG